VASMIVVDESTLRTDRKQVTRIWWIWGPALKSTNCSIL